MTNTIFNLSQILQKEFHILQKRVLHLVCTGTWINCVTPQTAKARLLWCLVPLPSFALPCRAVLEILLHSTKKSLSSTLRQSVASLRLTGWKERSERLCFVLLATLYGRAPDLKVQNCPNRLASTVPNSQPASSRVPIWKKGKSFRNTNSPCDRFSLLWYILWGGQADLKPVPDL